MKFDCDALVIGGGVAGAAAAIFLAQAGWRITLVEQHIYPRRKVCGECISAGNLALLDRLGIGTEFRAVAGPELRRVGWMDATAVLSAEMPACATGPYAYGRALGRDRLDTLLMNRAHEVGVTVVQPGIVRAVDGERGCFACLLEDLSEGRRRGAECARRRTLHTPVVVDAHGSWERAPRFPGMAPGDRSAVHAASDLFAFKASFRGSTLAPGFLPVLALPGGYGGMVLGDEGRTTLACCVRRDALAACRAQAPGETAGIAVERLLVDHCRGVREVLAGAVREGPWLSVGPLRPGIRVDSQDAYRVGNAAGESHPLIGEGISMALQSSALLAAALTARESSGRHLGGELQRAYAHAWRAAFAPRLRMSAVFAQVAMRPSLAIPVRGMLERWPPLLRVGARLAGKAARAAVPTLPIAEIA